MGKRSKHLEKKFSAYASKSINLPLPAVPTRSRSLYQKSLTTILSKSDYAKFEAMAVAMKVTPAALLRGLVVDALNEDSAG